MRDAGRGLALPDLSRGTRSHAAYRPGAARSPALRRSADRDSVGQQDRARAAGARRDVHRRAVRAHRSVLFLAVTATTGRSVRSGTSMRPGLVFADDGAKFERALASRAFGRLRDRDQHARRGRFQATTAFDELIDSRHGAAVDDAHAPCDGRRRSRRSCSRRDPPDRQRASSTRSGCCARTRTDPHASWRSSPTSRRCCATGCRGITRSAATTTSASTLYNGGTLYLDSGKPMPGAFATTIANLREIATTAYFNVPRGYELLLPALRDDERVRRQFFSRLQMLFYAAAGLRQRGRRRDRGARRRARAASASPGSPVSARPKPRRLRCAPARWRCLAGASAFRCRASS